MEVAHDSSTSTVAVVDGRAERKQRHRPLLTLVWFSASHGRDSDSQPVVFTLTITPQTPSGWPSFLRKIRFLMSLLLWTMPHRKHKTPEYLAEMHLLSAWVSSLTILLRWTTIVSISTRVVQFLVISRRSTRLRDHRPSLPNRGLLPNSSKKSTERDTNFCCLVEHNPRGFIPLSKWRCSLEFPKDRASHGIPCSHRRRPIRGRPTWVDRWWKEITSRTTWQAVKDGP